jgi:hypothetical protein
MLNNFNMLAFLGDEDVQAVLSFLPSEECRLLGCGAV